MRCVPTTVFVLGALFAQTSSAAAIPKDGDWMGWVQSMGWKYEYKNGYWSWQHKPKSTGHSSKAPHPTITSSKGYNHSMIATATIPTGTGQVLTITPPFSIPNAVPTVVHTTAASSAVLTGGEQVTTALPSKVKTGGHIPTATPDEDEDDEDEDEENDDDDEEEEHHHYSYPHFTKTKTTKQVKPTGYSSLKPSGGVSYKPTYKLTKSYYPTGTGSYHISTGTGELPYPTAPSSSVESFPSTESSTEGTVTTSKPSKYSYPTLAPTTEQTTAIPTTAEPTPSPSQAPSSSSVEEEPQPTTVEPSIVPIQTTSPSSVEEQQPEPTTSIPIQTMTVIPLPASSSSAQPQPTTSIAPSTPSTAPGSIWKPTAGMTWQIQLLGKVTDISLPVNVYDIDLIENDASTIASIKASGKKVICYFSAGSYENWRPDQAQFTEADKGKAMEGWAGEWWLNTNSANVRKIMTARLDLAQTKGCDAVDPDNVDVYANDNGISISKANSVDYLKFLSTEAHARGMSVGLKNGGDMIADVLDVMDFQVNEQCVEFGECDKLMPFINSNKPVFHIEYPNGVPTVAADQKQKSCTPKANGFSSLLKNLNLDAPVEIC